MHVKILHFQLVYGQRTMLHFLHNFFLSVQCLSIHTFSHRIHASNFPSLQKKEKKSSTLVYKMLVILSALAVVDRRLDFYVHHYENIL